MKCKITPELSSKDWKEFCSRFHFDNDKLPLIRAIYTAMLTSLDKGTQPFVVCDG